MDRELDYDFEFADDVAAVENKEAASTPSWSERHPVLAEKLGSAISKAMLISFVLGIVYVVGGRGAVESLVALVAAGIIQIVQDAISAPWWIWVLIVAAAVLSDAYRTLKANHGLLEQIGRELDSRR